MYLLTRNVLVVLVVLLGLSQLGASVHHTRCTVDALELQVALDRSGFSPGVIDGHVGMLAERALTAFANANEIATAAADCAAWRRLSSLDVEALTSYTIGSEDVAGPFVPEIPVDLTEQSKLPSLSYTSPLEALSEKFHTTPEFLATLNPRTTFEAGEVISVPNVLAPHTEVPRTGQPGSVVSVVVRRNTRSLEVRADNGRVVFYAPVTVGSEHDPLPIGTWKVTSVRLNPPFRYNPELFWDSDPMHAKAKLPPGPNNPVGVVWIAINKENYGLHGTPEPARIGYSSSHGCVRLTNWDALKVAELVKPGTRVLFE